MKTRFVSHNLLLGLFVFGWIAGAAPLELPAPTGPHSIGRTLVYATSDRPETWTPDPNDKRILPLIIWYPAEVTSSDTPTDYLPYNVSDVRGPLRLEASRGRSLSTHTFADASLADIASPLPIILFSAGANTSPAAYHALIEDLVSHGYLAAAMDHAHHGIGQIAEDGRLLEPVADTHQPEGDFGSETFQKALFTHYLRRVDERVEDTRLAIETLRKMSTDPESRFHGKLDLDRVATFGHSLGGVAAAHALADIPEVASGANIDGHIYSLFFTTDLAPKKPFLCIEAPGAPLSDDDLARFNMTRAQYEETLRVDAERQLSALQGISGGACRVTLQGVDHAAFTDSALLTRNQNPDRPSPVDGIAATRHYLLAFFEKTLSGSLDSKLTSDNSGSYPFVTVETFGALSE